MMGRAQWLQAALMLAVVSCLAVVWGAYQDRQQMTRLEGNHLYSAEAVAASVSPAQALHLVRQLGGANRAFVALDGNGPTRVVAIGEPSAFRFPSSDGARFAQGAGPQAIVGALAQTSSEGGRPTVQAGDRRVPVVGALGSRPESLLAYDVLVLDDELFAQQPRAVVTFDGPDAGKAARATFGDAVRPVRAGAADRTNVDVISPVLVRLGGAALGLSAVLTGVIIASAAKRWFNVSFVLGRSRWSLLRVLSVQFAAAAIPGVLLAVGLGWATASPGGPRVSGAWFMVAALATGLTALHVWTWRIRPWN